MTSKTIFLIFSTYISIIFHAVDGIMLAFQNKKARPVAYAYSKPSANSSMASRNMAVLGTLILVFIATHMANFWWKAKISSDKFPLHVKELTVEDNNPMTGQVQKVNVKLYLTTSGDYVPVDQLEVKNKTDLYAKGVDLKMAEGYKDLHSLVFAFFGHNKSKEGFPVNEMALGAVLFYTLSMLVLGFHLWHGFSSAFQSLGLNHPTYMPLIKKLGYGFAVLVPLLFAIIPILIFITK
jgi:succinate dehydrogenase / fumarate reductase cytochrome b subunit